MLRIETALAQASMDRTARRDPKNRDHKMSRDEADGAGTQFLSEPVLRGGGRTHLSRRLNVTNPDFFKQVNGVLETESLDSLKTYVSWHVLNAGRSVAFATLRGGQLQVAARL